MHVNLLFHLTRTHEMPCLSCRSRSGVMRPHSPSPFLHSRRVVLECSDACVVSFFGQSVPEVPYARSSPACIWNSAFPFLARATRPLLPWLARWTRPLARASQDAMSRRRLCAVHEPAICGYDRSFAALSTLFDFVRFSYHRPFGCIARPAAAVVGGKWSWRAD